MTSRFKYEMIQSFVSSEYLNKKIATVNETCISCLKKSKDFTEIHKIVIDCLKFGEMLTVFDSLKEATKNPWKQIIPGCVSIGSGSGSGFCYEDNRGAEELFKEFIKEAGKVESLLSEDNPVVC